MTPTGGGYDRDIGPRTARGRSGFIGRRPDPDDLTAPGSGEITLDTDAEPDIETARAPEPDAPLGAPDDLKRGERQSDIADS
jgi:hypothetical protein